MAEPAPTTTAPAETFEDLYRRAFPRVYAYVATLLRDRAAAEEVTAQAFERAYRKRRSLQARARSAEAWLFGIARNAALDELRRRKRRAAMEADPEDAAAPSAEEHAEHALRRETVRAALATLDAAGARPGRPEVLRRAVQRRDRARASARASRTREPDCTESHREAAGRPAMSTPDTFMDLLEEELTPEPGPRFAAEMDEWVARRVPRRGPRRRRRGAGDPRGAYARRSMSAAATAVAGLAVALVLGRPAAPRRARATRQRRRADPAREPRSRSRGDAAAPTERQAVPPAAAGGDSPPASPRRRIERSLQLTLAAPADDFQSVADRILRITDSHDGFVLRSNVATGEDPSGDFQLRVPGDQLQATLRDLAALGDVRARNDIGPGRHPRVRGGPDRLAATRAERARCCAGSARGQRRRGRTALRDRLDANGRRAGRPARPGPRPARAHELRDRHGHARRKKGGEGGAGAGGSGTDDALDDSLGCSSGRSTGLMRRSAC